MSITSICPKCRGRLDLPEMRPAQIHCQRCATSFWLMPDGAFRTSGATAAPAMPAMGILDNGSPQIQSGSAKPFAERGPFFIAGEEAKRNPLILGGIIAGSMLLLMLTAILLIVCLKSPGTQHEVTETPNVSEVPEPSTTVQPVAPAGPSAKLPVIVGWAKYASAADVPGAISKGGPKPIAALKGPKDENPAIDQEKIDRAIARGVDYLKKRGKYQGYLAGTKALTGLTLLSCGVPANDPAVREAASKVRGMVHDESKTYELALCLLFLDRLGQREDRERIRHVALRLIAAQGWLGGWGYSCLPLSAAEENDLLRLLKDPPAEPPTIPMGPQTKTPVLSSGLKTRPMMKPERNMKYLPVFQFQPGRKWKGRRGAYEDNSLTQFAILALWAAQKHGIPSERSLAMAEARFRASQAPDGSWSYQYHDLNRCKYSMTCAGLLGLAAGRGTQVRAAEDGKQGTSDPEIDKALRFVSTEIGTDHVALWLQSKTGPYNDTTSGWGGLYFLWSLERVAVVYDLRTIGGKDWYAWGAPMILDAQQADGSWQDTFAGIPDTCFALLFLKRTNVVQDLTQKIQFLTMSKDVGVRMRESEPAPDAGFGRQREGAGSVPPGIVRRLSGD